jgi:deoxyadenosine/deoxycytidine kinase
VNGDARILVVAGNIATGKTHLLDALSSAMGLPAFPERWDKNPWFDPALREPFLSQMWFLLAAGTDHARLSAAGGVQERCIHDNVRVFARELLADEDLRQLEHVYRRLDAALPDPTLLIHLTASADELLRRVRARGRVQEQGLTTEYLGGLSSRYRDLIDTWTPCPVLEIDTEATDLRTEPGLCHVLGRVTEKLL